MRAVERNSTFDELTRGDIVLAYFPKIETTDDVKSSVQVGIRPAVVIQNDKGNKYSGVIQLSPITSRVKTILPTHVSVEPNNETGLSQKSTILVESTRPIDKHFIKLRLGRLSEHLIPRLNNAIAVEFGLV